MMRRISILATSFLLAILALGFSPATHAQSNTLSGFALGALPNPVGVGDYTTLTGVVFGNGQIAPDGQIDFFISGNQLSCNDEQTDLGSISVNGNGAAMLSLYNNQPGTYAICANYINDTFYQSTTTPAGPYLLTVEAPTQMIVVVPQVTTQGSAVTFTVILSTPSNQDAPTGTIQIEDPLNGYKIVAGPTSVSTITFNNTQVPGAVLSTSSLFGNGYVAVYNGDSNYEPQQVQGQFFIANPLTSMNPAAFMAGASIVSPYLGCQTATGAPGLQATLTGINFNTSTTAQIHINGALQTLELLASNTTQLTVCIPQALLTSPAVYQVETITGNSIGGPINFTVYAPFAVTTTDSSNPTTFAYGSNLSAVISGTATRTAATDAAVPAGTATFAITPVVSTNNPIPITIGTGQFGQIGTLGTYQDPFTEPVDSNSIQKMVSADLNGDGYVDIVGMPGTNIGFTAAGPYLQIFLSTGANSFQTEQQVFVGCSPQDFTVGDIDGDNIPDLVVVCTGAANSGTPLQAYYLHGNGDGTFQTPTLFGTGSSVSAPTQVVLGWFNNDGYNDIAVIDGIDGYLQIISPFGINTCDNNTFVCGPPIFFYSGYGPAFSAAAADFNQDGLTDIVLGVYSSQFESGAIQPLQNAGNGNFNALGVTTFSSIANIISSMAVTDVNGDGYPDVVIADPGLPITDFDTGNLLIFENDGSGNLQFTLSYPAPSVGAVAGAPFPIIGEPASNAAIAPGWNLVYAGATSASNGDTWVTEIQRQNASTWTQVNTFDTGTTPFETDGSGPIPGFIVAGNLNGDGYLDFAANGNINDDAAPSGYLTEIVPFYYGNDAQVSLTTSAFIPTPGNYNLNMNYPGNQLFQANNTATTQITVLQGNATGGLSGPGTATYGVPFNLSAVVTGVNGGALPGGSVTPFDCTNANNPVPLGSPVALTPGEGSSTATLNVTQPLSAGVHQLCINYTGDADYLATNNIATTPLQVNGQTISLSITTSASAGVTSGAMVNIQVQGVGVALPAGETVSLSGLPFLNNPTATFNASGIASFLYGALPPGSYTVSANYAGDNVYAPAQSGNATFTVNPTSVTVDLSSSANPITYPATVNLTAIATSGGLGVPVGSIAFDDNGSQLSSLPLAIVNGNSGLLAGNTYAQNGETNIVTVTGDFNRDGNPDIATLQSNANSIVTLVVALGNGDGTFQTPTTYNVRTGVANSSDSMAAADLTGSGFVDSLVIGAANGNIMIFEPDASGALALSQPAFASGYSSVSAVAADSATAIGFKGIVVASNNSIETFANNGTGAISTTGVLVTNSQYSNYTGLVMADFNQDTYIDFAASDNNSNTGPAVDFFLYDTEGANFFDTSNFSVGASATGIAAGNLNSDAYPDVAVLSSSDSTVDVLLNTTTASGLNFQAGTIYGVATSPTGVAIGDFNGDGFADIAVTGNGTGAGSGTSILLSSSTGAMVGEALLTTTGGSSVATADFNVDGNTDLAVGSNGVTIFLDSAAQAVGSKVALNAGTQPLTAVFTPAVGSNFATGTSSTLDEVVNQDVPVVTWANPAAINYGTALSATQLDAVPPAGIPGTLTYSPAAGTVLTAGTHQLAVTFTPNDAVDYQAVTEFATIVVNQAASSVTWTAPAAITYPTALSATQLDATASVPGTFAYDPASGTVLTAGTHTLSVTFTPTDSVDYSGSTSTVSITVARATPTVTWANPAGITYGTALSAAQLDATASVPGVLTYTPAAGAVLTAGTQTLSVTFSPTDGTDYQAVTRTATIVVGQATSTVTWASPAAITYGTALSAAQLNATASVPGTFVYNPAAGTVLTGGTHALSVTFTPTDATDYQSSTGTVNIQVNQAAPTITWTNPAAINYGTALSATQLDATASVPGTFAYNPALGTKLTAGAHTLGVTFTPTDTTDYSNTTANATIIVNQATTTVTWNAPAAITYGTALGATQLNATASVPGTFVYNPAASTVLTAGSHTLSVTFTPTDNTDYLSSTSSVTITVNQATPTVNWTAPGSIRYGTALSATQLDATASVPGTFAYSPAIATVLTAGTHTLSVTFTPTDSVDYKLASDTVSITVTQATSTVTWNAPAAISYGTALSAAQLNATASVPGTFAYSPAAGTVLSAGAHPLSVTFTPTDSVDYKGASATVNITVNQGNVTITWPAPAAITYGTALSATQLDATSSVPGTFTYNPALGTVLTAGSHQLSVTFAPTDGTDYSTTTSNVTIQVNQGTSSITWAAPAAITYGTALSATQLDATASVAGTFAYNPALGATLTAGTHTLSVTFTPTDATDYQSSTSTVSIQVKQAAPSITWTAPAAITYGTVLSGTQLNATTTTAGTMTYTPAVGTTLTAGSHTLSVSFAPTDTVDYTTAIGSVTIQVNQATPVITWPSPGSMTYGTPLSATQLDATAKPTGGTFTYNPPAGTTLPVGTETLSVTYVPADATDYATATATTSVSVIGNLALSSIAPTGVPYGSTATTITLTGIGFTTNSVVQLNGAAISTAYVSPTQLSAQIPASFFQQLTAGSITVFDSVSKLTSTAATFTVTLPNVQVTFSGPGTAAPGEQPSLNLTMSQAYPVDIQGTMTLTVDPIASGGPVDPAVQFATGGSTFNFTIPAGSTTTPTVQIQTGTIASTIYIALSLEANDQPLETGLSPIEITVPNAAPVITNMTLTRNGDTLTVNIVGYSSTRDMTNAVFDFTAASGQSVSPSELNIDVSSEFTTWYSGDTSVQYGSSFSYSQVFNLSNHASTVGSVSVVMTNSTGQSNQVSAQ